MYTNQQPGNLAKRQTATILAILFMTLSFGRTQLEAAEATTNPAPNHHRDAKLPFALVKNDSDNADTPMPLAAPSKNGGADGQHPISKRSPDTLRTVVSSLAIVLGLFALFAWFAKRSQKKGASGLPTQAVETLGRVPLNAKQEMHLVRIGNKLLLLAVTATSAETLTEITDPAEIERLTGICQREEAGGLGTTLRDVMSHLGTSHGERGYVTR